MAPAEIWQGGKLINTINEGFQHVGKLDGHKVKIEGKDWGFYLDGDSIRAGNSVTLDSGEIVVATKK